jgi:hypothetical protein
MSDFYKFISSLRPQKSATISRSDALKPLLWLIALVSAAVVMGLTTKPPEWLLITNVMVWMFCILLYAGAYVFCLLTDRDSLRSERYSTPKESDPSAK